MQIKSAWDVGCRKRALSGLPWRCAHEIFTTNFVHVTLGKQQMSVLAERIASIITLQFFYCQSQTSDINDYKEGEQNVAHCCGFHTVSLKSPRGFKPFIWNILVTIGTQKVTMEKVTEEKFNFVSFKVVLQSCAAIAWAGVTNSLPLEYSIRFQTIYIIYQCSQRQREEHFPPAL